MHNVHDVSDREFGAYLCAFARSSSGSFHYDLMGNYIVLPDTSLTPSDVYEYLHEFAHSQLGNGVLGMTVQTLTELLGCVEHELFIPLRELISELPHLGSFEKQCHFDLYVYGRTRGGNTAADCALQALRSNLRSSWAKCQRDAKVRLLQSVFLHIRARLQRILKAWLPVHEGLAVYTTIDICLSRDHDAEEQVANAIDRLTPLLGNVTRREVGDRLDRIAKLEQQRWRKGNICEASYLRGFRLCEAAAGCAGGRAGPWIAALASSHFPYHCCDLLNMDEHHFDAWVDAGEFDFERRFRALVDRPALLRQLVGELNENGGLSADTMQRALQEVQGHVELRLLSEPARRFGSWERDYLWKSQSFSSFLEIQNIELAKMEIERLAVVDDDRTGDFRIPGQWAPPMIVPSSAQSIVGDHDEYQRLRRRFMNVQDVERTAQLVAWLSGD